MRKRISVDAAILENRPYIQLRGVDYELRDLTSRQRIERIVQYQQEQREAEEVAEAIDADDGDDATTAAFERVQRVIADAVQEALVDVPDEVAGSITEMEWKTLMVAIARAREMTFSVAVEDVKDDELKTVGRES